MSIHEQHSLPPPGARPLAAAPSGPGTRGGEDTAGIELTSDDLKDALARCRLGHGRGLL